MPAFQPRTQSADTSLSFLAQTPALSFGVPVAQNSDFCRSPGQW